MSNRSKLFFLSAAALIALIGFWSGFNACLHLKTSSPDALREQNLELPGNASPVVRAAIVQQLRELQKDYAKRDPKTLDSLAQSLFPHDGDTLILGTDGGVEEWVRGAPAAKSFIAGDWQYWGDLHFDSDRAIVWSSGDVAWIATVGVVRWTKRERPIRFTAILTWEEGHWVFRQMHFQWDDADPKIAELLRPSTYARLLSGAVR